MHSKLSEEYDQLCPIEHPGCSSESGALLNDQHFNCMQAEKEALEEIVAQQSHLINLLREESVALRRDLSYIGNHINIRVAPTNPALLDSEPSQFQGPHVPQQPPLTAAEAYAEPQPVPSRPEVNLLCM